MTPFPLLDEQRLTGLLRGRDPELFARIAAGWVARVPDLIHAVRVAPPGELAGRLHELRSGAVPVGLSLLSDSIAGIEQRVERGQPPSPDEFEAAFALAHESAIALTAWWEAALPVSGSAPPGPRG